MTIPNESAECSSSPSSSSSSPPLIPSPLPTLSDPSSPVSTSPTIASSTDVDKSPLETINSNLPENELDTEGTRAVGGENPSSSPIGEEGKAGGDESESDDNASIASSTNQYPLGGSVSSPSIDATSFGGGDSDADGMDAGSEGIHPGGGKRKTKKEDVTEEEKKEGLRLKSEANKLFSASKYREALDLYTASLNQNQFDSAVWCNRAAVRLKLEEYGLAISDASMALKLDENYVKAFYRRALANLAILKPKAALVDFKKVLALDKKNVAAKQQHDATLKLVKRMEFEKAIASEDDVPTSTQIREQLAQPPHDPEPSYTGPRLTQTPKSLLSATAQPSNNGEAQSQTRPPGGGGVGAEVTKEFVEGLVEWFKDGKTIPKRYAWQIVLGAQENLVWEESLVEMRVKEGENVDVIGDTHGQFFDFLHLLSITGRPSETHTMVFNGDFVDRGSWSTEVVLVLFAYKWLYPNNVFLNRGNHETADMNKVYGFEGETKKKYSEQTYKLFEEVFAALPIATLITASKPPDQGRIIKSLHKNPTLSPEGVKRFYVVHGGLYSKDGVTLEDVRKVPRLRLKQPGSDQIMQESLWADPQTNPGRGASKRGVGLCFGPDVTKRWTIANEVTAVIRSHEVRHEGYSVEQNGLCITVFSAPNYVDQAGNMGGIVTIDDEGEITLRNFKEQPHPDIKPMAYASMMPPGLMGLI